MPIAFSVCLEDGYVNVTYVGKFSDVEILDS